MLSPGRFTSRSLKEPEAYPCTIREKNHFEYRFYKLFRYPMVIGPAPGPAPGPGPPCGGGGPIRGGPKPAAAAIAFTEFWSKRLFPICPTLSYG